MKTKTQKILSTANAKIVKGLGKGFLTAILHFAPSKLSGKNVCPNASIACILSCLNTSGMGIFSNVQTARIEKTKSYFQNPVEFQRRLYSEIESFAKKAMREDLTLCIRLNGTSDIPKLAINTAKDFPDIQFYDYTKNVATLRRSDLPANYDLTFSRSESNKAECIEAISLGFRLAVVADETMSDGEVIDRLGLPFNVAILDGDEDDLTFTKPKNCILRLKPKGKAKDDLSGFVLWTKKSEDRIKAKQAKRESRILKAFSAIKKAKKAETATI